MMRWKSNSPDGADHQRGRQPVGTQLQDIPVRTCGEQSSSVEKLGETKLFRPRVNRGKILGEQA